MTAVRAVLTMTVPAERAGDFEREWARVAQWVQRQPGCLRQTLTRLGPGGPAAEPTYVVMSDWVDDPTYRQFETSSRQDDATAGLRRLRTGVHMDVHAIIEHRESA